MLHSAQWFLWSPLPVAARAALEELAVFHHKQPYLNHIFLVPRLFTSQWRRLLHKTADVIFELPAGSRPAWPLLMHEPLVIGLTLRFAACPPFQLRHHPSVLELGRPCMECGHGYWEMRGVFCANFASPRLHWRPCHSVWHGRCYTPHLDDHFVYHVVTDEDGFDWRPQDTLTRYKVAHDGDHLLTTFQCDLCWLRSLQRRDPLPDVPQDRLLLCVIRHALLDALWGQELQTVGSTLRAARSMVAQWQKVGLTP
jgi:hypothetical protein